MKCATNPVAPAITIGHGGANNSTDARKGMKTTEEPRWAWRGTGRNAESLATPSNVNATNAFQNDVFEIGGTDHSAASNSEIAAPLTKARTSLKVQRSN